MKDFMKPDHLELYRRTTNQSHASYAGVGLPSFKCKACGEAKLTAGRKMIVSGAPKFGFVCRDCADKEMKK